MRLLPCLRALAPIVLALAFGSAPALAQDKPRSMADCEKIKGDLAYNQCLANFGPAAGLRAPRGGPDTDPGLQAAEEEAQPVVRRGRRGSRTVARSRSGRQSASFVITRGQGVGRTKVTQSRRGYRNERRYRRRR